MTKKRLIYVGLYLALIILATLLLGSKKLFENKISLTLFYVITSGIIIHINSYTEKLGLYLSFGQTRKQIFIYIYRNILIMLFLAFIGITASIIIKAIVFSNINIIDELLRFYENGSLYVFIVSLYLLLMLLFKNKYLFIVVIAIALIMFLFDVMNFVPWLGIILIVLFVVLYFVNKYYLMKIKIKFD